MTSLLSVERREKLEALKISALSSGARITESALAALGGRDNLTVHEYATTGGIPLKIDGLDINVPFDEWYCSDADIEIATTGNQLIADFGGDSYQIEAVHPLPSYLEQTDAAGNRVADVVYTHIDRIRLSPISGCAYDCAFCDMPGRIRLASVDHLLNAARIALRDPRFSVRHALISGGSPGPRDEDGFAATLVALVSELSSDLEIDVMMSAGPRSTDLIPQLVEAGVHGFSINLEVESDDASNVHIRGKNRRARPHYDDTIAAAVEALGAGRVRSLILPGLESAEETLVGVRHIASLGADPVLSPFRPAQGTLLAKAEPVSASTLKYVLQESRSIVEEYGVKLGPRCFPCQHNTLSFPWDIE